MVFREFGNTPVAEMHLPYAQSFAAVQTFAAACAAWTRADILTASFTQTASLEIPGTDGEINGTGYRMTISVRKPNESKTKQITLPAPRLDNFDHLSTGYQVKPAIGEAIAAAYSALCGETYVFVSGKLVS